MIRRSLALVLAVVGGVATAVGMVGGLQVDDRERSPGAVGPPVAVQVLAGWDRRRAAAYSTGDPAALARLYAPGSRAGAADVAMLEEYADRGLRVRGLRTQVIDVRVLRSSRSRLVLRVTDRLVGAVAVGEGTRVVLPAAAPQRRRITFVQSTRAGRWKVAAVRRDVR